MIPVLYQDPFSPVLTSSEILIVSAEQKLVIKKILDLSSSDSRFSQKAYDAINVVLTGGSVKVPTVTGLTPATAMIGDPSFTIHVKGTNFTSKSVIVFSGYEEPTTFVGRSELTTGVNMDVWHGAAVVSVGVLSEDGILSNMMDFTFTEQTELGTTLKSLSQVKPSVKEATPLYKESLTTIKKEEKK